MPSVTLRSFAKINLGLRIGARREDGFHELRTLYQTVALHDVVRIELARGSGIELRCRTAGVPLDESNTCYRMAERVMRCAKARGKVIISIEKKLPMQGGLGAASSNAVSVLLGLERLLKSPLEPQRRLELAAEVGSDVPLFLLGGLVLGLGRGEQVYPLEDLPALECVIATPRIGVSTPLAFKAWDALVENGAGAHRKGGRGTARGKLTEGAGSDTIEEFCHAVYAALGRTHGDLSGVSSMGGGRAEPLLLDLVRAGIDNDFERVVFPQHAELREVKRVLEREGAALASLSGSGSSLFGLFDRKANAVSTAMRLAEEGVPATATRTLPRREYWKRLVV